MALQVQDNKTKQTLIYKIQNTECIAVLFSCDLKLYFTLAQGFNGPWLAVFSQSLAGGPEQTCYQLVIPAYSGQSAF